MLPAPPPRQPSQKRPAVQWDMGGLLDTEHARMKSMSPQAGIRHEFTIVASTSAERRNSLIDVLSFSKTWVGVPRIGQKRLLPVSARG